MTEGQSCPLSRLEKLLAATDRSAFSEGALTEALSFAKKCSSQLYVMSVLETNPEYETIGAEYLQKEEAEAVQYLKAVKERAKEAGVPCEAVLRRGDSPSRLIVEEASKKKVDMIVIGRHGRKGLERIVMGTSAAKVIGHAPCKVLVVPKAARIEYRNILVATDGSQHSDAAALEAVEIAKRCGSHLVAVSVALSDEDIDKAKVHAGDIVLAAQRAGLTAETITPVGKPAEAISELAGGRGVDLIVMGTYGRTGLRKLLMGSTTQKVIGMAGCAVLVVSA